MAKFTSQGNRVRFMMLATKQVQKRTPCLSVLAVGVPDAQMASGKLADVETDVHVPRINSAIVLYVTAEWSEDRQAYRVVDIHKAGDKSDTPWTEWLQNLGWVTDKVNGQLWKALGFRLRPNPVITSVVLAAVAERRSARTLRASALKYHLSQGVPQAKAIELVTANRLPASTRQGYAKSPRRNFRDKPRTNHQKQHKSNRAFNRPFANLDA